MSNTQYEAAVIGASLGGCAAAIQLGKAGHKVLLLDSQSFPRPKPCGEGLSFSGLSALKKLKVPWEEIPHTLLDGYRLRFGRHEALMELSPRESAGAAFDREELDNALLEVVQISPSVEVALGCKVVKCDRHDSGCKLVLTDGRELAADYVIVASGSGTGFSVEKAKHRAVHRYGCSQHATMTHSKVTRRHVDIFIEKGYEIFVTPIGETKINVAMLARKDQFQKQFPKAQAGELLKVVERKWDCKLEALTPVTPAGPIGNMRREPSCGRMFFVGDACEQFDPIGGMGMTHALQSGMIAAECFSALIRRETSLESAAARYARERNAAATPLRGFTRLTYLMLIGLPDFVPSHLVASSGLARHVAATVHHSASDSSHGILSLLSRQLVEFAGR